MESPSSHSGTRIVAVIFLVIGLALSGVSTYIYSYQKKFMEGAEKTTGTVTQFLERTSEDIDGYTSTSFSPVVEFKTKEGEQKLFTASFSSNPPAFDLGEEVEVLYDPDNPDHAQVGGEVLGIIMMILGLLMGGVSSVFLLVGGIMLGIGMYKSRRWRWVKENGEQILADYKLVEKNHSYREKGVSPWRIVAEWIDPQTMRPYLFYSENLWEDPTKYMNSNRKKVKIPVRIDPKNKKRYYMDVGFLPGANE